MMWGMCPPVVSSCNSTDGGRISQGTLTLLQPRQILLQFLSGLGAPSARLARRERPRRRAAEQRDELSALHSITSSARASRDGGTSSASALAVLRLITSSNFVGS